jgi:calpain-15
MPVTITCHPHATPQGAWGDGSPLWRQYPKVARALDFRPADDGTFWMDWKDFQL